MLRCEDPAKAERASNQDQPAHMLKRFLLTCIAVLLLLVLAVLLLQTLFPVYAPEIVKYALQGSGYRLRQLDVERPTLNVLTIDRVVLEGTGEDAAGSITLSSVLVRYSLSSLLAKKLESVHVTSGAAVIMPSEAAGADAAHLPSPPALIAAIPAREIEIDDFRIEDRRQIFYAFFCMDAACFAPCHINFVTGISS